MASNNSESEKKGKSFGKMVGQLTSPSPGKFFKFAGNKVTEKASSAFQKGKEVASEGWEKGKELVKSAEEEIKSYIKTYSKGKGKIDGPKD